MRSHCIVTGLVQPLPFVSRGDFLRALLAELTAAGTHNPGVVRKVGQRRAFAMTRRQNAA